MLQAKKSAIIENVKSGLSLTNSAKRVGVPRSTAYFWRSSDGDFRAAISEAQLLSAAAARIGMRRLSEVEGG